MILQTYTVINCGKIDVILTGNRRIIKKTLTMPLSDQQNIQMQQLIFKLKLLPHPEGGYFRETYRSKGIIESGNSGFNGERNYSTSIYFLLTSASFSAFHRIPQDEIWHFYDGSPIHLHMISPDGIYTKTTIGRDIKNGEIPQFVVPGGAWFGAIVLGEDDFALVGCTVAPGFDFLYLELGLRADLVRKYPKHQEIISSLTRE